MGVGAEVSAGLCGSGVCVSFMLVSTPPQPSCPRGSAEADPRTEWSSFQALPQKLKELNDEEEKHRSINL